MRGESSSMESKTFTSKTGDLILLRPATFADIPALAITAMAAYDGTPLDNFLSPRRSLYPADTLRMYCQRICLRWLNPRNLSLVACPNSSPEKVIGYTQFHRLGDDEGARRQIASRRSARLTVQSWYYMAKFKVVNYFWPDRSADFDAWRRFQAWCRTDDDIHWESFPERANRWYLQSMVVSPVCQGAGIGKRLIAEVLDRASRDGVVVGLEASADGEKLYRRVGFEFLSRFTGDPEYVGEEGGVMMWTPEKVKAD